MQLSIVIVNYNVKFFLEQCLLSVKKAISGIDAEVFVVDNASVDGSIEMLHEKFDWVKTIANSENVGFSRANNQAIKMAKGQYVLLLNPDTVVEENSFSKCIAYAESKPSFGALGVKMIDGLGNFLPESKRGLPTPAVAFYKMFGLAKLFAQSKRFGAYHLSYLSADASHEIDVLSGAYMFITKKALDDVGLLDETFFMYGEDIDLSYRIQQGGYKNFYFSGTTIIHYKGESTKKGSINYVYVFYKAMVIFAQKHFTQSYSVLFGLIIYSAIYLRMAASLLKRGVSIVALPLLDVGAAIGIMFLLLGLIEKQVPSQTFFTTATIIASSLLAMAMVFALYKQKDYFRRWFRSILPSLLLAFTVYSFLPEDLRFSRLIIALLLPAYLSVHLFMRFVSDAIFSTRFLKSDALKKLLIFGTKDEMDAIKKRYPLSKRFAQVVEISHLHEQNLLTNFEEIVRREKAQEIVFSATQFSSKTIMKCMMVDLPTKPEIKIAPVGSNFIIGSNSIHNQGSVYTESSNFIGLRSNQRKRKTLQKSIVVMSIVLFPAVIWSTKSRSILARARKIWVSKMSIIQLDIHGEPGVNQGLFSLHELFDDHEKAQAEAFSLIKDYSIDRELYLIVRWLLSV